jgi:hypothetical protein
MLQSGRPVSGREGDYNRLADAGFGDIDYVEDQAVMKGPNDTRG